MTTPTGTSHKYWSIDSQSAIIAAAIISLKYTIRARNATPPTHWFSWARGRGRLHWFFYAHQAHHPLPRRRRGTRRQRGQISRPPRRRRSGGSRAHLRPRGGLRAVFSRYHGVA